MRQRKSLCPWSKHISARKCSLLVNTYFLTRELNIIICMYWELLTRFLECKMNNGCSIYVSRYFSLFSLDMFSISQEEEKQRWKQITVISYLNILSKPFYLHMIPKPKNARTKLINVPLRILYCNTARGDVLVLQEKEVLLQAWKFLQSRTASCLVSCSVLRHWFSMETAQIVPNFLFFLRFFLLSAIQRACLLN